MRHVSQHIKEPSRRIGLPEQEAIGALALLAIPAFGFMLAVWGFGKILLG
jgi:hypothetical protein